MLPNEASTMEERVMHIPLHDVFQGMLQVLANSMVVVARLKDSKQEDRTPINELKRPSRGP